MAKGKSKKSSKKSVARRPKGRSVKIGNRSYNCYAKRVKKGFGRKGKTTRAFCYKPVKK